MAGENPLPAPSHEQKEEETATAVGNTIGGVRFVSSFRHRRERGQQEGINDEFLSDPLGRTASRISTVAEGGGAASASVTAPSSPVRLGRSLSSRRPAGSHHGALTDGHGGDGVTEALSLALASTSEADASAESPLMSGVAANAVALDATATYSHNHSAISGELPTPMGKAAISPLKQLSVDEKAGADNATHGNTNNGSNGEGVAAFQRSSWMRSASAAAHSTPAASAAASRSGSNAAASMRSRNCDDAAHSDAEEALGGYGYYGGKSDNAHFLDTLLARRPKHSLSQQQQQQQEQPRERSGSNDSHLLPTHPHPYPPHPAHYAIGGGETEETKEEEYDVGQHMHPTAATSAPAGGAEGYGGVARRGGDLSRSASAASSALRRGADSGATVQVAVRVPSASANAYANGGGEEVVEGTASGAHVVGPYGFLFEGGSGGAEESEEGPAFGNPHAYPSEDPHDVGAARPASSSRRSASKVSNAGGGDWLHNVGGDVSSGGVAIVSVREDDIAHVSMDRAAAARTGSVASSGAHMGGLGHMYGQRSTSSSAPPAPEAGVASNGHEGDYMYGRAPSNIANGYGHNTYMHHAYGRRDSVDGAAHEGTQYMHTATCMSTQHQHQGEELPLGGDGNGALRHSASLLSEGVLADELSPIRRATKASEPLPATTAGPDSIANVHPHAHTTAHGGLGGRQHHNHYMYDSFASEDASAIDGGLRSAVAGLAGGAALASRNGSRNQSPAPSRPQSGLSSHSHHAISATSAAAMTKERSSAALYGGSPLFAAAAAAGRLGGAAERDAIRSGAATAAATEGSNSSSIASYTNPNTGRYSFMYGHQSATTATSSTSEQRQQQQQQHPSLYTHALRQENSVRRAQMAASLVASDESNGRARIEHDFSLFYLLTVKPMWRLAMVEQSERFARERLLLCELAEATKLFVSGVPSTAVSIASASAASYAAARSYTATMTALLTFTLAPPARRSSAATAVGLSAATDAMAAMARRADVTPAVDSVAASSELSAKTASSSAPGTVFPYSISSAADADDGRPSSELRALLFGGTGDDISAMVDGDGDLLRKGLGGGASSGAASKRGAYIDALYAPIGGPSAPLHATALVFRSSLFLALYALDAMRQEELAARREIIAYALASLQGEGPVGARSSRGDKEGRGGGEGEWGPHPSLLFAAPDDDTSQQQQQQRDLSQGELSHARGGVRSRGHGAEHVARATVALEESEQRAAMEGTFRAAAEAMRYAAYQNDRHARSLAAALEEEEGFARAQLSHSEAVVRSTFMRRLALVEEAEAARRAEALRESGRARRALEIDEERHRAAEPWLYSPSAYSPPSSQIQPNDVSHRHPHADTYVSSAAEGVNATQPPHHQHHSTFAHHSYTHNTAADESIVLVSPATTATVSPSLGDVHRISYGGGGGVEWSPSQAGATEQTQRRVTYGSPQPMPKGYTGGNAAAGDREPSPRHPLATAAPSPEAFGGLDDDEEDPYAYALGHRRGPSVLSDGALSPPTPAAAASAGGIGHQHTAYQHNTHQHDAAPPISSAVSAAAGLRLLAWQDSAFEHTLGLMEAAYAEAEAAVASSRNRSTHFDNSHTQSHLASQALAVEQTEAHTIHAHPHVSPRAFVDPYNGAGALSTSPSRRVGAIDEAFRNLRAAANSPSKVNNAMGLGPRSGVSENSDAVGYNGRGRGGAAADEKAMAIALEAQRRSLLRMQWRAQTAPAHQRAALAADLEEAALVAAAQQQEEEEGMEGLGLEGGLREGRLALLRAHSSATERHRSATAAMAEVIARRRRYSGNGPNTAAAVPKFLRPPEADDDYGYGYSKHGEAERRGSRRASVNGSHSHYSVAALLSDGAEDYPYPRAPAYLHSGPTFRKALAEAMADEGATAHSRSLMVHSARAARMEAAEGAALTIADRRRITDAHAGSDVHTHTYGHGYGSSTGVIGMFPSAISDFDAMALGPDDDGSEDRELPTAERYGLGVRRAPTTSGANGIGRLDRKLYMRTHALAEAERREEESRRMFQHVDGSSPSRLTAWGGVGGRNDRPSAPSASSPFVRAAPHQPNNNRQRDGIDGSPSSRSGGVVRRGTNAFALRGEGDSEQQQQQHGYSHRYGPTSDSPVRRAAPLLPSNTVLTPAQLRAAAASRAAQRPQPYAVATTASQHHTTTTPATSPRRQHTGNAPPSSSPPRASPATPRGRGGRQAATSPSAMRQRSTNSAASSTPLRGAGGRQQQQLANQKGSAAVGRPQQRGLSSPGGGSSSRYGYASSADASAAPTPRGGQRQQQQLQKVKESPAAHETHCSLSPDAASSVHVSVSGDNSGVDNRHYNREEAAYHKRHAHNEGGRDVYGYDGHHHHHRRPPSPSPAPFRPNPIPDPIEAPPPELLCWDMKGIAAASGIRTDRLVDWEDEAVDGRRSNSGGGGPVHAGPFGGGSEAEGVAALPVEVSSGSVGLVRVARQKKAAASSHPLAFGLGSAGASSGLFIFEVLFRLVPTPSRLRRAGIDLAHHSAPHGAAGHHRRYSQQHNYHPLYRSGSGGVSGQHTPARSVSLASAASGATSPQRLVRLDSRREALTGAHSPTRSPSGGRFGAGTSHSNHPSSYSSPLPSEFSGSLAAVGLTSRAFRSGVSSRWGQMNGEAESDDTFAYLYCEDGRLALDAADTLSNNNNMSHGPTSQQRHAFGDDFLRAFAEGAAAAATSSSAGGHPMAAAVEVRVTTLLDLGRRELSFIINGRQQGTAFQFEPPADEFSEPEPLFPIVTLGEVGDEAWLVKPSV